MYPYCFEKFEEMVQKCAAAAVRDVRLAWTNSRLAEEKININLPLINRIIAAYKSSCFGKDLSDFYIKRVRDEFVFLVGTELMRSCHNQAHYDLMLSILFFRCIMVNECNPDSVKDREAELKSQLSEKELNNNQEINLSELPDNYFDACLENEKWVKRRSPWIRNYDSGEPLTIKLYQLEENKKAFYNAISAAEREAIKANFHTNDAVPLSVRVACTGFFPLKDQYETVTRCSEYSRIGCFLYDLLDATANKEQPLDTILKLYMIAEN